MTQNTMEDTIGKQARSAAAKRWSKGWSLLSPEQREGAVCREFVLLLLGQVTRDPAVMELQAAARDAISGR